MIRRQRRTDHATHSPAWTPVLIALVSLAALTPGKDAPAAEFRVLKQMSPALGAPIVDGSTIYGSTYDPVTGGSLFKINIDGSGFETLHNFSSMFPGNQNGWGPSGQLAFDGINLYGAAERGGEHGKGTIFAFNTSSRSLQLLASNDSPWGENSLLGMGVSRSGNTLVGARGRFASEHDAIYRIQTDGSGYQTVLNLTAAGYRSPSHPLASGDTIYGTASGSGGSALFAMNLDGSNFRVLHEFLGTPENDGEGTTLAPVSLHDSTLYGVTPLGGIIGKNLGTVYRIDADGSDYEVLRRFSGLDGSKPASVVRVGSKLVGITLEGGTNDAGTVFTMDPDGANFEVLHNFIDESSLPPVGLVVSGNTAYGFRVGADSTTLYAIVVPEPGSVVLGGLGLLTLLAIARHRRRGTRRSE